ncbi:flagellar filament capping protein FliD [Arthrobacter sp. STN4]|uniref:flagellar filament capping protein FliD n=1 Tax=Arthrobacter sp. STN4 TaxID=2923276 RepID=UPI00211A71D4|nr:flagellar filament capping protein FliD [Arthrobacter sp. STN4]MCQ9162495.1 flagellar filament capping protein FliD [Arthrobacter sp. STN4]
MVPPATSSTKGTTYMGMGIDGLSSGLDTTSIINALMNAEAIPQTQLKSKVSGDTYLLNALQALNSKFAALTTQAAELAKPDGLAKYQVASTSPAITATLAAGAKPVSLDLTVTQLAQAQSIVTAPLQQWPTSPPVLTFVKADGTTTEVTAVSGSLDDVAYAVNKSAAGVSAVKVASGTAADGTVQYRLQLTATDTGAANAFTAYDGSAADVAAGTAASLTSAPGAAVLRTGQDAQVTMWAGTPAEQTLTSASNTFTAIAPGLDVTVHQLSASPVTLNVTRDAGQVTDAAKDLVSNVNIILGSILTQSAVSGGGAAGAVTSGLFTSNSTTAAAKDGLFTAVVAPVNGRSPATIGINSTKNGDFTFDADAFAAAYAKDPAAVEGTLQVIAQRVADAAKAVSDPYDGTLSQSVKGQQTVIDDLNGQILKWDDRLAQRRGSLQAIYANLEVQLNKMQSQQNWLSSQISSLDPSSSPKK